MTDQTWIWNHCGEKVISQIKPVSLVKLYFAEFAAKPTFGGATSSSCSVWTSSLWYRWNSFWQHPICSLRKFPEEMLNWGGNAKKNIHYHVKPTKSNHVAQTVNRQWWMNSDHTMRFWTDVRRPPWRSDRWCPSAFLLHFLHFHRLLDQTSLE